MSAKQENIKKMLEMQKKFIELEQKGEITPEAYWVPESGSELDGFREDYMKIAMEVLDQAHKEKGSKR